MEPFPEQRTLPNLSYHGKEQAQNLSYKESRTNPSYPTGKEQPSNHPYNGKEQGITDLSFSRKEAGVNLSYERKESEQTHSYRKEVDPSFQDRVPETWFHGRDPTVFHPVKGDDTGYREQGFLPYQGRGGDPIRDRFTSEQGWWGPRVPPVSPYVYPKPEETRTRPYQADPLDGTLMRREEVKCESGEVPALGEVPSGEYPGYTQPYPHQPYPYYHQEYHSYQERKLICKNFF